MSKNYSISNLAAEFGISTRTIRFYEEKNLLNPRRVGAMREYAAAERIKLMLILRGKRLGFSLQESREIIDLYDPVEGNVKQQQRLMERIVAKQSELLQKRKEINSMLKDLKQGKENCEKAIENNN